MRDDTYRPWREHVEAWNTALDAFREAPSPARVEACVALIAGDPDGDDERQHIREDDLRAAVLEAIARGNLSPEMCAGVAAAALATARLKFARWCA